MLIFLDTNIWVYAYEDDPKFGESARVLMQGLRSGKHRIAGSLFVLNELLVLPTRRNDAFTIASYRRLFSAEMLEILPYTSAATKTYAELRAFHRAKPLDAIHLATAAAASVDLFITQDEKLLPLTVPGIGQIVDLNVQLGS
jgi:predicted nucleic acid-binding protein